MSPRPKKPRNCNCPNHLAGKTIIKPAGTPTWQLEQVILGLDELECLRLCDSEGLSQSEAGDEIGVSRGTVQRLVNSGRKKIIDSILNNQALIIQETEPEE
ncbi:MAG: hypothetical protein C0615_02810 [Desulfuromonas sp.]|nr:MAG: hypothetical protein C0615_02810 [Desulfuromonas sp.]